MKIHKYKNFIFENIEQEVIPKLSNDNKDMKENITRLIQKTINTDDIDVFKEKIDTIIKNPNESTIEGLIQDADVYEFYLKYRNDIDEVLSKNDFFTNLQDFQNQNTLISLYDFVVKGTLECVSIIVNDIKEDISKTTQEQ